MATLDPSIILGVKPVQVEDPLNKLAQVMQIQGFQRQGQMQDMDLQQRRQGVERQNRLSQLLGGFGAEMTPEQQAAELTRGGFLEEAQSVTKTSAENIKAKEENKKAQLENFLKQLQIGGQILSSVKDPISYQRAARMAVQSGFPAWPEQYDPAWVNEQIIQGKTLKEQADEKWNAIQDATTRRGQDLQAKGQMTNKPPAGYRWTPDGALEAIPGGPADIKAGELGLKNQQRKEALSLGAQNVISAVNEASDLTGFNTAGLGAWLANIPATDARDLRTKLDTVKANLGFDRLQQMRDMSPTGGALGAVAVQELNALQSTVASLDQGQKPEQLKKSLQKIAQHYNKWLQTLNGGAATGGDPAVGAVQDGYRFKGGNPADPKSWEKL